HTVLQAALDLGAPFALHGVDFDPPGEYRLRQGEFPREAARPSPEHFLQVARQRNPVGQIEVNAGVQSVAIAEPGGMLAEMDRVGKHAGGRYDAVSSRLQDALADTTEVAVIVRIHDQACTLIG